MISVSEISLKRICVVQLHVMDRKWEQSTYIKKDQMTLWLMLSLVLNMNLFLFLTILWLDLNKPEAARQTSQTTQHCWYAKSPLSGDTNQ